MDIRPEQTVAELVIRHPEWRERLEMIGLDYCCGGKRPLGQAVAAAGLEWSAFVATLSNASAANAADTVQTNWNKSPLGVLVDHILEKHHSFTKGQLSRLDGLLTKVEAAHGAKHGEMLARLRRLFDGLHDELDAHLMKEEQILFPAIKGMDAFVHGQGEKPVVHCGSIANPIRQMEVEHDRAGEALAGMRRVTDNYRPPLDACQTFRALYDGLQALEADLHEHIHLENNILFPSAAELEATMTEA
jgi:regulator of cell morphogenesis and NO signaling